MANRAYLLAFPSRAAVDLYMRGQDPGPFVSCLESPKYGIATLWLAAFGSEDCVVVHGPDQAPYYVACCATGAACVERLVRRREAMLELIGESWAGLYDAWIAEVAEKFPGFVFMKTEEIFWMTDFERADRSFRQSLATLEPADRGEPITELDALGSFDALAWDVNDDRSSLLVGWGEGFPPVVSRQDPSAVEELCARLEVALRDGVGQVWAEKLPAAALDVLWARGALAQVYAIAAMMRADRAAATLAWYAGLDPEPGSQRATDAALAALRALRSSARPLDVLAHVPLQDARVVRLARRVARGSAERLALALRLDDVEPALDLGSDEYTGHRAVLWALAAVRRAQRGQWEDSALALASAHAGDEDSETLNLLAFRALFAGVPVAASTLIRGARACHAAVLLARQAGDEVARGLLARFEGLVDVAEICLVEAAAGLVQRPADHEARVQAQYEEGLIDPWTFDYEVARTRSGPREAGEAALSEAMQSAYRRVDTLVDAVAAHCALRERDESQLAAHREALARLVVAAQAMATANSGWLRKACRAVRALAEMEDADCVGAAVIAVEKVWGPVQQWSSLCRARDLGAKVELLGCAAGRSLDAMRLIEGDDHSPPIESLAYAVAGLARDGHLELARTTMVRVLAGPWVPDALPPLVAAAVILDRSAAARFAVAIADAAAALRQSQRSMR